MALADTLEIVDPSQPTTTLAALHLSKPVSQHAAGLLPDGRLVVTGRSWREPPRLPGRKFGPQAGVAGVGEQGLEDPGEGGS